MGLDKRTMTCIRHCSIMQGIFTVGGLSPWSRKMVSRNAKDLFFHPVTNLERDVLFAGWKHSSQVDAHWLCVHTCPSQGLRVEPGI